MIEVVSIKFKNRGKSYFFSPNGLTVRAGDRVVVETSKGLELADCCRENHEVMDNAVVQPLRPVIRIATADDLRVAEINRQREKEAFDICQQKIAERGLDMKLVDVECNFEGNKTTFFFTSDGRVDFRELVKDLAGIFRNRIELRQIGVRDEAKLLGGIGICGRPYCCNQFLDDFQPVSTKMAKVQSLSLNPAKISGSCGRLMCCLRYEQEAYEDLVKKVPKQGAFVETKDGYGTAVQVNLLRQTVKVKLDSDSDDTLKLYKAGELASVPGGRPKDGETPPSVLRYIPEEETDDEDEDALADPWLLPVMVSDPPAAEEAPELRDAAEEKRSSRRRRGNRGPKPGKAAQEGQLKSEKPAQAEKPDKTDSPGKGGQNKRRKGHGGSPRPEGERKTPDNTAKAPDAAAKAPRPPKNGSHKTVRVEAKPAGETAQKKDAAPAGEGTAAKSGGNHRRRNYYRGKPKTRSGGENKQN